MRKLQTVVGIIAMTVAGWFFLFHLTMDGGLIGACLFGVGYFLKKSPPLWKGRAA